MSFLAGAQMVAAVAEAAPLVSAAPPPPVARTLPAAADDVPLSPHWLKSEVSGLFLPLGHRKLKNVHVFTCTRCRDRVGQVRIEKNEKECIVESQPFLPTRPRGTLAPAFHMGGPAPPSAGLPAQPPPTSEGNGKRRRRRPCRSGRGSHRWRRSALTRRPAVGRAPSAAPAGRTPTFTTLTPCVVQQPTPPDPLSVHRTGAAAGATSPQERRTLGACQRQAHPTAAGGDGSDTLPPTGARFTPPPAQ